MRLFISTDAVGGVWDYVCTLAGDLVERGHDVMVAVVGPAPARRLDDLPDGVETVQRDYRLEWMPDAAEDVEAAGRWLADAARRWGADVVHLNQMAYSRADFAAPTVVVAHSDVLSWFSEAAGTPAPPEWDAYARWVRDGLHAADVVVAPSGYQAELVRRHYGRGDVRVIHNGAHAPGPPDRLPARALALSIGRCWDAAKGMAVVDRAAERLARDAVPVHLVGALVGPHGERFDAEHALCHGPLPRAQVDQWLARGSVYIGASLYEPFGLAPLEAALNGCALVLSDIPSFRELWDGCAVFFPKGDAEALAASVTRLLREPRRRDELAGAARSRAIQRYTTAHLTSAYLALYDEITGGTDAWGDPAPALPAQRTTTSTR